MIPAINGNSTPEIADNLAFPLRGDDGSGNRQVFAFGGNNQSGPIDVTTACNAHGGTGRSDFESETFVAFSSKDDGRDAGDLSPTLRSMNYDESHINGGGQVAVAFGVSENQRAETRLTDISRQIASGGGKPGQGYPAALTGFGVRRLTPVECSRLQGFPDDWNEWGVDESGQRVDLSDSVRYRQDGNAVCATVSEWIGLRLIEQLHGQ